MTTDAETFHALAGDDLVRLGFSLANDPKQTRGRYSDSSADYECSRGLRLSVGFENDSGSASRSVQRLSRDCNLERIFSDCLK